MYDVLSKDDYRKILDTMMVAMRHLEPEKRVEAGLLCNKIKHLSEGTVLKTLSIEEFNDILEEYHSGPPPREPTKPTHTDFDTLVDDIRAHVKSLDKETTILPADDPMHLMLGWVCTETEECWTIKLAAMKKSIDAYDDEKRDIMRRAMGTHEGKMAFAAALSAAASRCHECDGLLKVGGPAGKYCPTCCSPTL